MNRGNLTAKLKESWKDPVWSKVISAGIIFILGSLFTALYTLVTPLFSNVSFIDSLNMLWGVLNQAYSVKLWMMILIIIFTLVFTLKPIVSTLKSSIEKFKGDKVVEEPVKEEIPDATERSTALFAYRMAKAFPGLRGFKTYEGRDAVKRLLILLQKPLKFKNGTFEAESDPIWWFRDTGNNSINEFKKIDNRKVLMNLEQLKIKRIAAYHGRSYYRDFVYVETEGEKQTGLYALTKEQIKSHVETFGYSWEEYGVLGKKFIRREHYEDGATELRGEIIDAGEAKLRTRYLTPYNFIIAAKASPYNSNRFDTESEDYFDGLLRGTKTLDEFFNFMKTLKKNEH